MKFAQHSQQTLAAATVAALERQEAQALEARQAATPAPQDGGVSVWESFHARVNGTARFYKERRSAPSRTGLTLASPAISQCQSTCSAAK